MLFSSNRKLFIIFIKSLFNHLKQVEFHSNFNKTVVNMKQKMFYVIEQCN